MLSRIAPDGLNPDGSWDTEDPIRATSDDPLVIEERLLSTTKEPRTYTTDRQFSTEKLDANPETYVPPDPISSEPTIKHEPLRLEPVYVEPEGDPAYTKPTIKEERIYAEPVVNPTYSEPTGGTPETDPVPADPADEDKSPRATATRFRNSPAAGGGGGAKPAPGSDRVNVPGFGSLTKLQTAALAAVALLLLRGRK